MFCCPNRRQYDFSLEDGMGTIVNNHELNNFKVNMFIIFGRVPIVGTQHNDACG
jgi:hypothetical protein